MKCYSQSGTCHKPLCVECRYKLMYLISSQEGILIYLTSSFPGVKDVTYSINIDNVFGFFGKLFEHLLIDEVNRHQLPTFMS